MVDPERMENGHFGILAFSEETIGDRWREWVKRR